MICITRRQIRSLRPLFRRTVLGVSSRTDVPTVVFHADEHGLVVRVTGAHVSIECVIHKQSAAAEEAVVPLDALADLEGRDDTAISIDPAIGRRVSASWSDEGIPVTRSYDLPADRKSTTFPEFPAQFVPCKAEAIEALAAVNEITGDDSPRYALDSIELRGATGEVAATDGHQLLIRSGLSWPWDETLLIHCSPIFATKGWLVGEDLSVGRTETHVVFRCGPWTAAMAIRVNARFPKLEDVIPASSRITSSLVLHPTDAQFLVHSLERLPGSEAMNAPVTLELNGKISVRAASERSAPSTDLILSRSSYTGTPTKICTNRNFLAFAARAGAGEIHLHGTNAPFSMSAGKTTYAWQPLSDDGAIPSSEDAISIASDSFCPTPPPAINRPSPAPRIVTMKATKPDITGPSHEESSTSTGISALIAEAEAIHATLAIARTRSSRLVAALRKHRKQNRLVQETLRSLHQLKLHDVAG